MIDIGTETLLSLKQAQDWLASRGVKRSRASIYRWVEEGKLETVELGGVKYTSHEAIQRMGNGKQAAQQQKQQRKRRGSREDYEETRRQLKALGV